MSMPLVGKTVSQGEVLTNVQFNELLPALVSVRVSWFVSFWYASSEPRPNRVLLFAIAPAQKLGELPPFVPNLESSERAVIYSADAELAFPLHAEAARRYFARGIG